MWFRRCHVPLVVAALIAAGGSTLLSQSPAASPVETAGEPLFDGKTLGHWRPSKFFGQGAVTVEDGAIVLGTGKDLTGITWGGPALPTTSYELSLQARRLSGGDFFAGITFPVGDSFCSLILGGWGGEIVGLSSINGMDASENNTSQSIKFELERWYTVRIRVTPAKIETWLDGRQIVDQELKGNTVGVRLEVEPSQPLGVSSWRTKGALRDIRLKRL
jgi:Domain of Unknown Function (DUF1080)